VEINVIDWMYERGWWGDVSKTSASRLWNKLPNHIKSASSKEIVCNVSKIHLLKLAYL